MYWSAVADRVGVLVGLVVAIGRHQHRAPRPDRIGMLALDLVELLGGVDPVAVLIFFQASA